MLWEDEIEIEDCLVHSIDRDLIAAARHEHLSRKNQDAVDACISKGPRAVEYHSVLILS